MKITYGILADTLNNAVDKSSLTDEIASSSITIALDLIYVLDDLLEITFKVNISASENTTLDSIVGAHTGISIEPEPQEVNVKEEPAFSSKKVIIDGVQKSIFKRVHGVSATILSGATTDLDFVIPYAHAKFTGANVFGSELKDVLDFSVHDNATNDYSGAPISPGPTYYPNFLLNQFGFAVEMPPNGIYENTSNYDADLFMGMIIRCTYTNNGASDKYIGINHWLHEVV